ncbi:hypothetical protein [Levilactobacillus sp. HBUAS70063]
MAFLVLPAWTLNRAAKGTPTAEPLFGELTAAKVLASNQWLNPT